MNVLFFGGGDWSPAAFGAIVGVTCLTAVCAACGGGTGGGSGSAESNEYSVEVVERTVCDYVRADRAGEAEYSDVCEGNESLECDPYGEAITGDDGTVGEVFVCRYYVGKIFIPATSATGCFAVSGPFDVPRVEDALQLDLAQAQVFGESACSASG